MKKLCSIIVTIILGLLSVIYVPYLRGILFGISVIVGFIFLFVKDKKQQDKNKTKVINITCVILFVLYVILTYKSYTLLKNYGDVTRYLNKWKEPYKIIKVEKPQEFFKEEFPCEYVFHFQKKDGTNVVCQASNCDMGTVMSFYEIRDNCGIKYADYYYEKYKKENDITFTMENTDTYLFLGKSLTITMKEETTIEEVCNFVNYLKQNVKQKFELYIKDKNGEEIDRIASWMDGLQYDYCTIH